MSSIQKQLNALTQAIAQLQPKAGIEVKSVKASPKAKKDGHRRLVAANAMFGSHTFGEVKQGDIIRLAPKGSDYKVTKVATVKGSVLVSTDHAKVPFITRSVSRPVYIH
jgi:hypothetical protein